MIFFDEYFVAALVMASLVYWALVPEKYRTLFVTVFSVVALSFIQPIFTLCLIVLVFCTNYAALEMLRHRDVAGKRYLAWGIILLVMFLLVAKYAAGMLGIIFGDELFLTRVLIVPLGVSYLCFKLIAYYLDVYRGLIKEPSLPNLYALIFFLPSFPAGPIERYQDFIGKRNETFCMEQFVEGWQRIFIGFFKKVVIINLVLNETLIKQVYPLILDTQVSTELSATLILLFLVGSLIYAYIDLSAYADLAIGFGLLFGFRLSENMKYPLFQSNLSDYWSRWHITLSGWCRNNVYFPVLGATRNNHLALYSSFAVMGLWHSVSLNWFIWGLWHASGITLFSKWAVMKKRMYKKTKIRLPESLAYGIGVLITCLYSGMGFSFIMFDSGENMIENTTNSLKLLLAIFL